MSSSAVTDKTTEKVTKTPIVSLKDIEAEIAAKHEFVAGKLLNDDRLNRLSICILIMKNGFFMIGQAAPISDEWFNPELGRQFAYEDAIRQIGPVMGYALRERLAGGK
jgi:hypothetical protein